MSQRVVSVTKHNGTKTINKTKAHSTDLTNQTSARRGFGSSSSLRQSTSNLSTPSTNNHNNNMGVTSNSTQNTTDMRRIEAEYIKNLQQQVYFLELEANFLREQAKKSTELQPQMTAEAKRMIGKLQELNQELNTSRSDVKLMETRVAAVQEERENVTRKLKSIEESSEQQRQLLMEEIVQLKKENEQLGRSQASSDSRLANLEQQLNHSSSAARAAESRARQLESQVTERNEQLRLLQTSLEEKRVECLRTEERLRTTEEKYYNSIVRSTDKNKDDLKDEVRVLKARLKEYEAGATQERYTRNKNSDDSARLIRENSALDQQISELRAQLDKSGGSVRNIFGGEVGMIDGGVEAGLRRDVERLREELKQEQEKVRRYIEQISRLEDSKKALELGESTLRSKVAEMCALHENSQSDVEKLRQDKTNLIDHIDQLQKQLDERQTSVSSWRSKVQSLEGRIKELEHLSDLQSSIQTQKWEEFSRLAENMKTLSRSLAKPGLTPSQWTNKSDPSALS